MEPVIVVHGGAGDIPGGRVPGKIAGVRLSASEGYKLLRTGGSALDAAELAVRIMEDDEHFNAGYGSVLNLDGHVEMGASVMEGRTLSAGAVALVRDVAHPISLARMVMERTKHVLLAADGAARFARDQGVEIVPPSSLVSEYARQALATFKRTGYERTEIGPAAAAADTVLQQQQVEEEEGSTVGAVALDVHGNLAAATSTGGMNGKMAGRIGDTPLIGCGTYADNALGAVSTTGHGESILKFCLAHAIVRDLEAGGGGGSAQHATRDAIERMTRRLHNTAGAITLSAQGDVGVHFTSQRMAWAYQRGDQLRYGINSGDDCQAP